MNLTIILNLLLKACRPTIQHVTLLTSTNVNRGVTLTTCWIREPQQKVKHHNRRL